MVSPITSELRNEILSLHLSGHNYHDISSELGVSVSCVRRWVMRFQSTGSVQPNYKGSQPAFTEEIKYQIMLKCIEDPFKPATIIRKELNLSCTPLTINNYLRSQGIRTHHAATKTRLNENQRNERINFATWYKDLDIKKCIFVDESCFSSERDGIKLVKRPSNSRYDPNYTNKSDHCTRKVVSTWGAITINGVGPLVPLDCRLDQYVYLEILDTFVVDLVRSTFGSDECYLVEDNCPAHRANLITEWFRNCNPLHNINLKLIKLPPYSPEFNLIENVWGYCKYDFLYSNCIPNDRDEMKRLILDIWDNRKLENELCPKLYESWEKRCDDVIRNNGFPIKY